VKFVKSPYDHVRNEILTEKAEKLLFDQKDPLFMKNYNRHEVKYIKNLCQL